MLSSSNEKLRKGQWSVEEDECLKASVALLGERRWDAIARATGLKRNGKSCRLRWLNYLRPNLKQSPINAEEEQIILRLHQRWGNKWARIARRLPGRTDNEIKNYWKGCVRKKTTQFLEAAQDYCTSKARSIQGTSDWNSDDDDIDYNNVVKEISMQKHNEEDYREVQDVVMSRPKSPYETHFSNWVLLLKSENEVMSKSHCNGLQGDEATLDGWEKLWDMDLFTCNN